MTIPTRDEYFKLVHAFETACYRFGNLPIEELGLALDNARTALLIAYDALEDRPPTQWAYDAACKALEKHRARADKAEAQRDALVEAIKYNGAGYSYGDGTHMLNRLADVLEMHCADNPAVAGWMHGWIECLRAKGSAERATLEALEADE